MIILDTCVIKEVISSNPQRQVLQWLDAQDTHHLYLTALSVAELFTAVESLAAGEQQQRFTSTLLAMFNQDFAGRILPFDAPSALHYAQLAAKPECHSLNHTTLQIAAICQQHQATLATSQSSAFCTTGIELINPWQAPSSQRWHQEAAEYYVMSRKT